MSWGLPSAPGTGAGGNNISVTPGLPSYSAGDILFLFAGIRSITASVDTPAGYTLLLAFNGMGLFAKKAGGAEVAPLVTFTGGAAGNTTLAIMWSQAGGDADNLGTILRASATYNNGGTSGSTCATNNATVVVPASSCLILFLGIIHDDYTSIGGIPTVPAQATGGAVANFDSTQGSDASVVSAYTIQTSPVNITTDLFTFSGGSFIREGAVAVLASSVSAPTLPIGSGIT